MKYIIGIDEVGRGALAGPVTVAAVAVRQNLKLKTQNLKLRDSKKLSVKQREEWCVHIKENYICAVARVYPRMIDKTNIARAANLAAERALKRLSHLCHDREVSVILDGALFLKSKDYQKINFPNAKTIVRGDQKFNAVKMASIVAKVHRDAYMRRLHKRHPQYGFHIHKGYGTKFHRKAIKRYGVSNVHRNSFTHRLAG